MTRIQSETALYRGVAHIPSKDTNGLAPYILPAEYRTPFFHSCFCQGRRHEFLCQQSGVDVRRGSDGQIVENSDQALQDTEQSQERCLLLETQLFGAYTDRDADATCVVLESPVFPKLVRPIYENRPLSAASRQLIELFNPLSLMIPSWQMRDLQTIIPFEAFIIVYTLLNSSLSCLISIVVNEACIEVIRSTKSDSCLFSHIYNLALVWNRSLENSSMDSPALYVGSDCIHVVPAIKSGTPQFSMRYPLSRLRRLEGFGRTYEPSVHQNIIRLIVYQVKHFEANGRFNPPSCKIIPHNQ